MHQLISDNFSNHASRIAEKTDGMFVVRTDDLIYVDSGLSCDTFNIIYIHSPNASKESLQKAITHFTSEVKDYCVWIAEENLSTQVESALQSLGISQQAQELGMVLSLTDYEIQQSDSHQNIKLVSDTESIREYAQVIAANWTPPDEHVISFYEQAAEHYLSNSEKIVLLTYYESGKPASTVEMFPTDDETIGLYGFATLETYRGQGIGTSLMTYCLNKAKELGYKNVILQGTEDGLGIYQKHGFRAITTYYEYA